MQADILPPRNEKGRLEVRLRENLSRSGVAKAQSQVQQLSCSTTYSSACFVRFSPDNVRAEGRGKAS